MSAPDDTAHQPSTIDQGTSGDSDLEDSKYHRSQPLSPNGLVLEVDFAWSKFRNTIKEKNGQALTSRYVQHFRCTKPQLRFNSADDTTNIGTGTISNISISAECIVRGRKIELKPLKRFRTRYNYLSHAFTSQSDPLTPVALSWSAKTMSNFKTWDFVCLDANQLPVAKFSANWWALKAVGKFEFKNKKEDLSEEQRDEIVVTGMTVFYLMMTRMNNPFHLVGAAIAKPGKVEEVKQA